VLGEALFEISETFIHPDISIFDYPHINKLLDVAKELRLDIEVAWERARGNDDAGKAE
jgi:hypothetical protein